MSRNLDFSADLSDLEQLLLSATLFPHLKVECISKDGLNYSEVTSNHSNSKFNTIKLPFHLFCMSHVVGQRGLLHSHLGKEMEVSLSCS